MGRVDNLTRKEILECFEETAIRLLPEKIREYGNRCYERCEIVDKYKNDPDGFLYFALDVWENAIGFKHLEESIKNMTVIKTLKRRRKNGMAVIPLEEIKQIPLLEIFEFKKIKRTGRRVMVSCPLHKDDTPSLLINTNNTWKCFSCNKGGTVIDFIIELYGLDFITAAKKVRELYGSKIK